MEQLGLRTGNRLTERLEKTGGGCPAGLGGGRSRGESFRVVLVWSGDETRAFPENFTVRPFVNQNEILKHAALFITAGGMNSLHEALYFGVPCLMCPQQGEQRLNARRFERLGFGKILQDPRKLRREALLEKYNESLGKELIKGMGDFVACHKSEIFTVGKDQCTYNYAFKGRGDDISQYPTLEILMQNVY